MGKRMKWKKRALYDYELHGCLPRSHQYEATGDPLNKSVISILYFGADESSVNCISVMPIVCVDGFDLFMEPAEAEGSDPYEPSYVEPEFVESCFSDCMARKTVFEGRIPEQAEIDAEAERQMEWAEKRYEKFLDDYGVHLLRQRKRIDDMLAKIWAKPDDDAAESGSETRIKGNDDEQRPIRN